MAKILVAEDEEAVLDVYTSMLELEDHEVLAATNGQEALMLARINPAGNTCGSL